VLRHEHPSWEDQASALLPGSAKKYNPKFTGGGCYIRPENWACLASLIETCKLNHVNPQTYVTDLLTRLVNGWPQNRIDELMPWHWAPKQPP